MAAVASFIGVAFQTLTLSLRARVRERSRLPAWLRPLCGALITWVLGCAVFLINGHTGVFGLGYNDLSLALNDKLVWQVAGVLVLAKFVATVASYGWGGCGGIFSPTLFLGGMTGLFFAGLAGIWLPLTAADRIVLAAVGMSACFNAVVRAPLTALLIVFEMTHQFSLVPALMFCSIVSQAIARLGGRHNFYDALLLQDGHELIRIKPPRDLESWQKLPGVGDCTHAPGDPAGPPAQDHGKPPGVLPVPAVPRHDGRRSARRGHAGGHEGSACRKLRSARHAARGMPVRPSACGRWARG